MVLIGVVVEWSIQHRRTVVAEQIVVSERCRFLTCSARTSSNTIFWRRFVVWRVTKRVEVFKVSDTTLEHGLGVFFCEDFFTDGGVAELFKAVLRA